jgi:serine/threonine protein kinase
MNAAFFDILRDKHGIVLGEVIGMGTFGTVYRGKRDRVDCAVKISRGPIQLPQTRVAEELKELERVKSLDGHARIVGLKAVLMVLNHLVTCWELGQESLADLLRKSSGGIDREELLGYMRQAAEGIDYMNQRGFVHRDIKPENLLVVQGCVKLADMGLAKFVGASSGSGSIAGTMGYMPPEAQLGRIDPITCDLYGLASTYVKLRTGKEPFGSDPVEIVKRQRIGKPILIGLQAGEEAAVRRALAYQPKNRFQKGAKAWVRLLSSPFRPATDTIPTNDSSRSPKLLEVARQNPLFAVVPLGVVVVLFVVICVILIATRGQTPTTQKSSTTPAPSIGSRNDRDALILTLDGSYDSSVLSPDGRFAACKETVKLKASGLDSDATRTVKLWDIASGSDKGPVRTIEMWDAKAGKFRFTSTGNSGRIMQMALSTDGKFLASLSDDKTLKVWDVISGQDILTIQRTNAQGVVFSPSGLQLALSWSREVEILQVTNGQSIVSLKTDSDIFATIYSPDGRLIATICKDHDREAACTRLWDSTTGKQLFVVHPFPEKQFSLSAAFSHDSHRLISALQNKVTIWDLVTQTHSVDLRITDSDWKARYGDTFSPYIAVSPDGQWLALGYDSAPPFSVTVQVWNASTWRLALTLWSDERRLCKLCFTPDGRRLIGLHEADKVSVWDTGAWK